MHVNIVTPKPHSLIQRRLFKGLVTPHIEEIWVAIGTKYGKTLSGGAAMTIAAPRRRQGLFRWVAPIYSQAGIGYKYCKRMLPGPPIVKPNKSDPSLYFPSLDTTIQFFHGQDPESLEGEAVNGYILDEAAKMAEEVYASAKTTTTMTRGPIIAMSTPRGKNWFYNKCMAARDEMEWALKHGQDPRVIFLTAPTSANPHVVRAQIESARKRLPARLFQQYFEAQFVDDGSVFSGFREMIYGPELDLAADKQLWFAENCKERTVVIGADWARTIDFTTFVAIDYSTWPRRVVGIQRFQGRNFVDAIKALIRFTRRFKEVDIVFHDKTGIGQVIDEHLQKTEIAVEGVVFTQARKSDMVMKLATGFEHKDLYIPNWKQMIRELDAYEVKTNLLGHLSFSAPSGQHDDVVSALMLAYAAMLQYGDREVDTAFLEDDQATTKDDSVPRDPIEAFYREASQDDFDEEYYGT